MSHQNAELPTIMSHPLSKRILDSKALVALYSLHAFVASRLDNCNMAYLVITSDYFNEYRIGTKTRKYNHIIPFISQKLFWLSIRL